MFFAGYLVSVRDVLSLAGRKVLGFTFPRGRDLGPILIAWLVSLAVLIFEKDLGSSLLFFGVFVAMLYVATERVSWIAIGLALFAAGAYLAYRIFDHVQQRVELWLDPFSQASIEQSDQLAKGIMGMASGGLFGTGLGQGRPWLVAFSNSDFIFASFGEELGLFGVAALLALYAVFVERGLRTALGVRDGFGYVLAGGELAAMVLIDAVVRLLPGVVGAAASLHEGELRSGSVGVSAVYPPARVGRRGNSPKCCSPATTSASPSGDARKRSGSPPSGARTSGARAPANPNRAQVARRATPRTLAADEGAEFQDWTRPHSFFVHVSDRIMNG